MNNTEFRKRINQHFSSKFAGGAAASNKEIAREAVQGEFRKRKRKPGPGERDYLSSGDEEEEGDSKQKKGGVNRKNEDAPILEEPQHTTATATTATGVYRDRAKERREGKNTDYLVDLEQQQQQSSSSIFGNSKIGSAEMSQYLVDRQLTNQTVDDDEDIDLDQIRQAALLQKADNITVAKQRQASAEYKHPRDLDLQTLFSRIQSSTCSTVGKGVLNHLQNVLMKNQNGQHHGIAVQSMHAVNPSFSSSTVFQRSKILFSLHGNIYNRTSSWEIPKEIIHSREMYDEDALLSNTGSWKNTRGVASTPIDVNLIQKIQSAFETQFKQQQSKELSQREQQRQQRNGMEIQKGSTVATEDSGRVDEEEEDDIFSGVGKYEPPTVPSSGVATICSTAENKDEPRHVKDHGIFEPGESPNSTGFQSSMRTIHRPLLHLAQGSADASRSDLGIAINSGDYGEDMDLDFDGSMEAELRELSGKSGLKGKKQDITTAALEYGSRGAAVSRGIKNFKDANDDE